MKMMRSKEITTSRGSGEIERNIYHMEWDMSEANIKTYKK